MLREILAIFRRVPGATLTPALIAAELDADPAVVEQMLGTLVRSGRLVALDEGAGCGPCPLQRICVGGLTTGGRCYTLGAGPAGQG